MKIIVKGISLAFEIILDFFHTELVRNQTLFRKIKQLSIGRAGFLLGGGEGYLETQQRAG